MAKANQILYIEDHDDTREIMKIILENAGFVVTAGRSGADCMNLYEPNRYDLILLNHTFDDVSGVSLCVALREIDKEIPILFYSSRAMPMEKAEALKAGANDYLIKPNDIFNIAEHIRKHIAEREKKI